MNSPLEHDGVYLEAKLPLSWQAVSNFDDDHLERWMHADAALLRALAVLEGNPAETERDLSTPTNKALDRLEAKIDLTLALVIQLLGGQTDLPPARHAVLRAATLVWTADEAPAAGAGVVSLYLSPKLPLPLMLPAHIAEIAPSPSGFRIRAGFAHLDEEVQDWLERTVFRHHRRAVQKMHGV